MFPKRHLIVSALFSLLFIQDYKAMLICFLIGWVIDIDHILDYFIIYKKMNIKKALKGYWYKDKIFVLLHSWEILILAFLIFGYNLYFLAFVIGFSQHLILDLGSYCFKNKLGAYFLIYRVLQKFKITCKNETK